MGIRSFKDKATQDINYGRATKLALRRLPAELHKKAQIKLARLGAATSLDDLRSLRGNKLEALRGDRKGQHSVRINSQYRICFVWRGEHMEEVEIVDYH
jgi:proteic killer suppression protein